MRSGIIILLKMDNTGLLVALWMFGGLCGLVVWFALIRSAVISAMKFVSPKPSDDPRTPVQPSGDTTENYKLSGVDKSTGKDVFWICEATSPENARAKGELRNIVVTRVEKISKT